MYRGPCTALTESKYTPPARTSLSYCTIHQLLWWHTFTGGPGGGPTPVTHAASLGIMSFKAVKVPRVRRSGVVSSTRHAAFEPATGLQPASAGLRSATRPCPCRCSPALDLAGHPSGYRSHGCTRASRSTAKDPSLHLPLTNWMRSPLSVLSWTKEQQVEIKNRGEDL